MQATAEGDSTDTARWARIEIAAGQSSGSALGTGRLVLHLASFGRRQSRRFNFQQRIWRRQELSCRIFELFQVMTKKQLGDNVRGHPLIEHRLYVRRWCFEITCDLGCLLKLSIMLVDFLVLLCCP